jgi:hypothetical protein
VSAASQPDPAAKLRYLNRGAELARVPDSTVDFRVFAPEPAAIFRACGKDWTLYHARNQPGLKRFMEILQAVRTIEADPALNETERDWRMLRAVMPELPEEAFTEQHLTRNQLADLVQLSLGGDGRPQKGEEATPSPASGTSSPSTAAITPASPSAS